MKTMLSLWPHIVLQTFPGGPPCTPQVLNKCLQIMTEVLYLQPGEYSLAHLYGGSQFKNPWKKYPKPVGHELRQYEE